MWQEIADAAPFLLRGMGTTILYTALGALGSVIIAFIFGLMALSPWMLVRGISRTIVEFFRGTSLLVQLFWVYFALPFMGFQLEAIAAATIAFAFNFGAYGSEIVRGAIVAVPKAQWEATVALSLTPYQRMRRVIMPQAIPEMIPPFGNLLVQILKSSALLFLLAINDFFFEVQELARDINTFMAYALALVAYFIVAQLLLLGMRWWERRAAARVGRGPVKATITTPESGVPASGGGR